MSKVVKRLLLIAPMLICLFGLSNNELQQVKANTNQSAEANLMLNRTVVSPVVAPFKLGFFLSDVITIGGCTYVIQVELSPTQRLRCASIITICEDTVDIYTNGSECS